VANIKSFAAEESARERIMSSFRSAFRVALEQALVHSVSGTLIQSIPGLGRVLVLAAGAVLVIGGEWSLGSLLAFQAYLGQVFGPAHNLAALGLQLQKARAAMERVVALLEIAPEDAVMGAFKWIG
jgi:ABC-type bacteriocin/lantibiotic exporter with double-glycine peptidase domain